MAKYWRYIVVAVVPFLIGSATVASAHGIQKFVITDKKGTDTVKVGSAGRLHVNANGSKVRVKNFPNTQQVAEEVDIGNLPETPVDNLPETQPVEGTVSVDNFPGVQTVQGDVGVTNFPAIQQVSGDVEIGEPGLAVSFDVFIAGRVVDAS